MKDRAGQRNGMSAGEWTTEGQKAERTGSGMGVRPQGVKGKHAESVCSLYCSVCP